MRGRFGDGSQVYPDKESLSVPEQNDLEQGVPSQAVPKQAIPQLAVPKLEESGLVVGPEVSERAYVPDRDVDLVTLRARLRALI